MAKINLFRRPEFYDIFGFIAFLFIIFVVGWSLIFQQSLPLWTKIIFMIIGIVGSIVDGGIIFNFFFKKKLR